MYCHKNIVPIDHKNAPCLRLHALVSMCLLWSFDEDNDDRCNILQCVLYHIHGLLVHSFFYVCVSFCFLVLFASNILPLSTKYEMTFLNWTMSNISLQLFFVAPEWNFPLCIPNSRMKDKRISPALDGIKILFNVGRVNSLIVSIDKPTHTYTVMQQQEQYKRSTKMHSVKPQEQTTLYFDLEKDSWPSVVHHQSINS